MVVVQARRYQTDICQSATEYPMNAAVPTKRKTLRYVAPAGSARPAMYAAKTPTTAQYMNHRIRFRPIDVEPFGMTVTTMTGPFFILSANSGVRISWLLDGRGIM